MVCTWDIYVITTHSYLLLYTIKLQTLEAYKQVLDKGDFLICQYSTCKQGRIQEFLKGGSGSLKRQVRRNFQTDKPKKLRGTSTS